MNVVPYLTLPQDVLKDIVVLKLDKLARRMDDTHQIKLNYTDAVVAQIAERCTEVETGARNIDYIMSGTILPRMSQEILVHMSEGELPSRVDLDVNSEGTFDITFGE